MPPDKLKPFIKFIVISTSEKEGVFRMLPDTHIIMNFQYSGEVSYDDNGRVALFNSI